MNNDDLNLHSMTKLSGWLRYCAKIPVLGCHFRLVRPGFSLWHTFHVVRHGHFTLKQLRLPILNEMHTNSCTGPRLLKYVNTKSWNIFKVKLQGSKLKRISPYHGSSQYKTSTYSIKFNSFSLIISVQHFSIV